MSKRKHGGGDKWGTKSFKRKEGYRAIVLTLNHRWVNISDDEAKIMIRGLLNALRRIGKAHGWKYHIYICFSRSNKKIKQVRPHFHIWLHAEPCCTVAKWINNYWNSARKSRRWNVGFVLVDNSVDPSTEEFFVNWEMKEQAEFMREQKLGM